ncbi:MAG: anaerobic ribonucleoside-triphosphate reductase, partial [Candidatus Nanoarchaeia archaeon]
KFNNKGYVLEEVEEVEKLKSPFIVPIAAESKNEEADISDDAIKLLAWIIAEGSIEKPGKYRCCHRISIYQSEKKHPEEYKEINNLLQSQNLEYSTRDSTPSLGQGVKMMRLNAASSRQVHSLFEGRQEIDFIPKQLLNMGVRQSRLFLDTYLKADGFEGCKITTTSKTILDGLQQIAVNAGYGSTILKREPTIGSKQLYVLRLIKHKDTYIKQINKVNYSGVIWCPNTDNETVIARRNGKVFITGNTPFTNLTMDLEVPSYMKDEPVIIGGEAKKETYKEFKKEMEMLNRAFAECMIEGDASGRVFTFPIPTYNITKDFDWDNPAYDGIWEMTAKYGIPYFSNFINSDMKPEDARSMCPLGGDEKVLIKSSRGRGLEYGCIRDIYKSKSKSNDYDIFADGKFVKGRFNSFKNQKMLKVVLANNHEISMSEEHLNFVIDKFNGNQKVLKGKQLSEGMYLPYSLKQYKGEGGNKELGFFVGAYAGDGSFDGDTSVIFSLENHYKKQTISKLQDIAKKYFGANSVIKEYNNSKLVSLKVHSRAAVGLCRDFVEGIKREKHYKARLFDTSIDFREGVLDGHYATDGGNRNRIYTSSKRMVESLNMLASTLGTTTCIYEDKRDGRLGKEPNYAVLIYKLNRKKYGNIWFKKNNKLWMKVKKVSKVGNRTAYCFEVKNDEPLFTIGTTGVLTHNCRLRLDQKELRKRGGGLFGANPQTGSIGVVTLDMPRIGFTASNEEEFFNKVGELMELAKESLEIKRKTIEKFTDIGLYPYSRFYLRQVKERFGNYWQNHFSTIGLLGLNEAIINFMPGENIATEKGRAFAVKVLDFMRSKLEEYQEETGHIYNLEATPGEGTTYRFARIDKKKFGRIKVANEPLQEGRKPYYTNSSQLPVNYTDDLFEALELQDPLQKKYTGGCIEKGNKVFTDKGVLKIEDVVRDFKKLKPIKALSYNKKKSIAEWDKITDAMSIDVKKHNKIRIKGEKNLDITTSDWHPFFVKQKIKIKSSCPICKKEVKNVKAFANHLRFSKKCRENYNKLPEYEIVEKRADELKKGDYILQNSFNVYPDKKSDISGDLMWLIGFFIGDGCISKFIDNRGGRNNDRYLLRFFSSSRKALNNVRDILNKRFGCNVNVIQNDKRSKALYEVGTSKKSAVDFFFKYGFESGEKVYNINVPYNVKKNLNKNNVFYFISGLIDSDAHIDKRDGVLEYYTVSPSLADDLLEIFTKAGLVLNKSLKKVKRKNEKNIFRLRVSAQQLTKIRGELKININKLNIKSHESNRKKRHFPVVRVKSASKVNVRDNKFYDLTTEKNHNYLAGKDCFVFIHNTVFHGFVGERLNKEGVKVLVKRIAENFELPYFTITPTFSICPIHGYIPGEHEYCPKCDAEAQQDEKYEELVQKNTQGGENG